MYVCAEQTRQIYNYIYAPVTCTCMQIAVGIQRLGSVIPPYNLSILHVSHEQGFIQDISRRVRILHVWHA